MMFTINPFAELSVSIPPAVTQTYVVIMIVLVAAGTLFDVVHKGSARYFLDNWRKSKSKGQRQIGGGEWVSLAVKTALVDVLASGEFCSARRRVAHLLTMYGFLLYVITTVVMVFGYPTPAVPTPAILPQLWWIGGLMICQGGYWFWFFIRADVAAEGNSPFRLMHADLFILSLLGSVTLGLVWAFLQTRASSGANVFFGLYVIATTVLFGSVPWSKFAHMFFKPAAAFEKRVSYANGTRSNLPGPADKPEQFGSARTQPRHY
ncbi:MAG: adenylyl-sulfate reductase [Gammaproteobacteria bacterium]